jgi:hypothetical protein
MHPDWLSMIVGASLIVFNRALSREAQRKRGGSLVAHRWWVLAAGTLFLLTGFFSGR